MTELQDYLDHNSQEKIVPHLLRRWIQFAPVPEGSFWMGGDPALDPFAQANEQPRHRQGGAVPHRGLPAEGRDEGVGSGRGGREAVLVVLAEEALLVHVGRLGRPPGHRAGGLRA